MYFCIFYIRFGDICIELMSVLLALLFYSYMSTFESFESNQNTMMSSSLFKFCFTLLSLTLTLSTDSANSFQHAQISDRQNQLIKLSLNENAFLQVCGENCSTSVHSDVCTWRQIECTDGKVTSMWASQRVGNTSRLSRIQMEWLPPTMQFIHLLAIRTPKLWKQRCLPRDLRYLFLDSCRDYESTVRQFDLSRLPQKMEELILIYTITKAVIHLDGLPDTMRLVYMRVFHSYLRGIVVDYRSLPEALKGLFVSVYGGSDSKVKEIGEPRGVKLVKEYAVVEEESQYAEFFKAKLG